jgi:hypothetical protein
VGLLLAGADRCLRELVQTFDGQPGVQALLEDSSIIVWTTLEKEEKVLIHFFKALHDVLQGGPKDPHKGIVYA